MSVAQLYCWYYSISILLRWKASGRMGFTHTSGHYIAIMGRSKTSSPPTTLTVAFDGRGKPPINPESNASIECLDHDPNAPTMFGKNRSWAWSLFYLLLQPLSCSLSINCPSPSKLPGFFPKSPTSVPLHSVHMTRSSLVAMPADLPLETLPYTPFSASRYYFICYYNH